jgi:hypothetical protein
VGLVTLAFWLAHGSHWWYVLSVVLTVILIVVTYSVFRYALRRFGA